MTNENLLVKMTKKIGFNLEVLWNGIRTELAKIYRVLNECDVMFGVHGAALTHFMFMKPSFVFIKLFLLEYIGYKIHPKESSLYNRIDMIIKIL